MNRFVEKAKNKIDKLSSQQILAILDSQNQELKLRADILDSMKQGLFISDQLLNISYFNRSFPVLSEKNRNLFFKADEHYNLETFFKSEEILQFVRDTVKSDKTGMSIISTRKNGNENSIIRMESVRSISERCMLFSLTDITFLSKIEERFKKNESLAAMTTMAAGVAHEIKNPLTSISIYVQLLQKTLDIKGSITKDEAQQSINVISDEIERLNKIAVDFLFSVRPLNPDMQLTDLKSVMDKTEKIVKPEADSKGITVSFVVSTSLPKAFIDASMIEQCLLNLIKNAFSATECVERAEKKVEIRAYTEGNYIRIDVSDNGIGMKEQEKKRIFEPYFTTKPNGTGLGLTTILKIMKEHNGEINVSSVYNEGTTFTLSLPVPSSERFRIEE